MDVLEDRSFQKEVDTVRALHQTVVSLRAALERSRIEIEELKERIWSSESCELALQTLSIENHILRQKIINVHEFKENTTQTSIPYITVDSFQNSENISKVNGDLSLEDKTINSKDTTYDEHSLKTDSNDSFVTEIKQSPRKIIDRPKNQTTEQETVDTPRKQTTTQETVESPRKPIKTVESTNKANVQTKSPRKSPRKLHFEEISPRKSPSKIVGKTNENIKSEFSSKTNNLLQVPKNESPLLKSPKRNTKNSSTSLKSPRKTENISRKITNAQVSPRQTLITVNVTLKSPKQNKRKSHTITSEQQTNNETSDSSSTPEITIVNQTTMDEQMTTDPQTDPEVDKTIDQKESDPENEEVDDIELIFTTDETTTVIKEELVSIADGNEEPTDCDTPILLNYKTVDFDTSDLHLSCDNMDKDLDDDVFHENEATDNFENENTENLNFQQVHNSKSDNSINRENTENESQRDKSLKSCYSYQDSSFESRSLDKDESFDKFDDKEKYLHKMWSNNSVLVETDISKCGIVDPEPPMSSSRRNTCPNPVPYRPIMHREAIAKHNTRTFAVKFSARNENFPRPILNEKQSPKTESEAQTDISALPNFWKSESYLAHKVQHQFTTLPSKFPMPVSQKSLRLSDKTKEARRVLLSDINFTSMVPELSRSADHLYQEGQEVIQTCGYGQYLNTPGPQLLRRYNTGDSLISPNFIHSQKFTWSPSDYSNFSSTKFDNSNMYLNRYRGSLTSINMQNSFDLPDNVKRRSYSSSHWRHNVPASFDNSRYNQTGHEPYRSVPTSPTRSRSVPFISSYAPHLHQYPTHFKHSSSRLEKAGYGGLRYINGSLPELHGDHDSGDSTDSLVEEAEQYLRSSIDCIVSGRDISHTTHTKRRASAPCPTRDSSPPRNWQPFLPHGIKDLRSDNWVKVIGPEGKIRGGRVRYVGYVLGQPEPFVGIELASNVGNSDGSFNNRRYFECSPNHALFIPFKKVVMGWRN